MSDGYGENNLIYNRFDIIHEGASNVEDYEIAYDGIDYKIQCYRHDSIVDINIWGKNIPEEVILELKKIIENKSSDVCAIYIQNGVLNYDNSLVRGTECILPLPEEEEELYRRLSKKERYNIRRSMRFDNLGTVYINRFNDGDIPEMLVNSFFKWKNQTHGVDYDMTPQQYVKKFHVNKAMELGVCVTDNENTISVPIAALFWCGNAKTAYFENFSYNQEFKKFSPGYLLYIEFLKELINEKYRTVFLGGAGADYKKKFNSIARECYSGYVYTEVGVNRINTYMKKEGVKKWGIYGAGNVGKAVLHLSKKLEITASFLIDREKKHIDEIENITTLDSIPMNDLIVVAIHSRNREVENFLVNQKYMYYDEWIKMVLCQ